MSIYEIINAAFANGYVPASVQGKGVNASSKKGGVKANAQTPSFGIKARAPLTTDRFERSSESQQPMVKYRGKPMSLAQAKTESFKEVDAHEQAHLSAAGQYAASGKVIDFDGNGIAVSGHVNIKMPHLNKNNPDETIKHARTVMTAARAPESFSELSSADLSVYAQAKSVLAKAESFKSEQSGKNPFATNPFARA